MLMRSCHQVVCAPELKQMFGAIGTAGGGAAIDLSTLKHRVYDESAPAVYFTREITPKGLIAAYEALGRKAEGKVAAKLSSGEAGNTHYLNPALIKDLVSMVNATIVECNTAYEGSRMHTADHWKTIKDHGFTAIAPFDLMDEDGQMEIPVTGGKHLKSDLVGDHLARYDYMLVLTHFKGHAMGGFGGALKNISIGVASSVGKNRIHTAGRSDTLGTIFTLDNGAFGRNDTPEHVMFIESMAEAASAVSDYMGKGQRMIYVSVMNNLSVDCDCDGHPAAPQMKDIGVLASLDPVALDQACVDMVYAAPDGAALIERMESRKGTVILDHAAELGLGSKQYCLIDLDR